MIDLNLIEVIVVNEPIESDLFVAPKIVQIGSRERRSVSDQDSRSTNCVASKPIEVACTVSMKLTGAFPQECRNVVGAPQGELCSEPRFRILVVSSFSFCEQFVVKKAVPRLGARKVKDTHVCEVVWAMGADKRLDRIEVVGGQLHFAVGEEDVPEALIGKSRD